MKSSQKNTPHYKLGKKYKRLGKMLMDEKTDLRDLVTAANELGLRLEIKLESNSVADEYALAA